MSIKEVQPGDLITASSWNLMVKKVLELEIKVNELLATGIGVSPVITQILPPSPPAVWRAGGSVEIHGRNFGFSRGAQLVTFDGVLVTAFKDGSSDTLLLIDIPPIPGLPENGKIVTLVVANGFGSTSRQMFILPVDIPITGAVIDVFWESVSPNPITPGVPVFIGYRLRSRAPVTATFTINPQILSPAGIGAPQVFNTLTQENTSRQIQLATMESRSFFVRIPSIPEGVTVFELKVAATAGQAIGSDVRDFPINSLIILPDPTIALTPLNFEAIDSTALPDPTGGSYSHADRTIHVRQDRSGIMSLRAEFQNTGIYEFQVISIGPANGWAVGLTETPENITIDAADFSGGATVAAETPKFFVAPPPAGTTSSAQVEFRVFRQDSTQGQSRRFYLELQN